jgi:hypothetical protein
MEDLNGKIVFQQFLGSGSWIAKMKEIQIAGAIAILYGTVSGKLASLEDFWNLLFIKNSFISIATVEPGQYGCALTASQPSGQITIPVAEVSQREFEEIRKAIINGAIIDATLTSEGMS